MRKIFTITAVCILSLSFYCPIVSAELVTNEGLPNREGVKATLMGVGFGNPDLPNREGVKIGPFDIHAALKTEQQFDSNIFLEDRDPKSDWITVLKPSAGANLKLGDNNLSLDYEAAVNLFADHTDQHYLDQRIRGLLEINLTDYKFSISDVARRYSERAGSEDTNRVKRQSNFLRTGVISEFEQLGFDVGYTHGIEDFISNDVILFAPTGALTYHDKDRFLHIWDALVSYRFWPKTSIIFEQYLGILDYKARKNPDSWFTESMATLKGDLREDFTANISAGFRYQDYKKTDLTLTNTEDYIGPVARGGFIYSMTDDDMFTVILERNVYESAFSDQNYYNVNHVGLDYTHFFTRKTSARLFNYYQTNLYPSDSVVNGVTRKRHDHLFGGGAELRYDIRKWASVKATYEYRQKESTFEVFDYKDHFITVSGTIGF